MENQKHIGIFEQMEEEHRNIARMIDVFEVLVGGGATYPKEFFQKALNFFCLYELCQLYLFFCLVASLSLRFLSRETVH